VSFFLFDTDHISLYQIGHARVLQNTARHGLHPMALAVITIEEQFSGWQSALRQARDDIRREHVYRRLADTAQGYAGWLVLPFSLAAMRRHETLVRAKLNVGSFDLKIAAIALDYQATVVTRNIRDFRRVPDLAYVDWSI
jgi:tRNA(fMet)-specific endonuclease VapC